MTKKDNSTCVLGDPDSCIEQNCRHYVWKSRLSGTCSYKKHRTNGVQKGREVIKRPREQLRQKPVKRSLLEKAMALRDKNL
ncbi:MAG TPA: hypothetical protein ENI27_08630 [bacterium]|nr:hypothetical protein [bacterium]